jgi:predicted DNA-binding transcriptional regulator AlpA
MAAVESNPGSLVLLADVLAMLRVSYGTLHRRIRDGQFPAPLAGRKSLAWRREEVERHIAEQPPRKIMGAAP